MRESIGGAWLVGIVVVFIVLFTSYLALTVNYSKAFKVKNEIISLIEENEGLTENTRDKIINYLNSVGYYAYGSCSSDDSNKEDYEDYLEGAINGKLTGYERSGNSNKYKFCVYERAVENDTLNRKYYRVTVFFKFDIPLLDNVFTFPVTGESKAVYFAKESVVS